MREIRYQQIASALRDLARGLAPGSVLPSEAELSRQFGASRVTVRRALETLRDDGLIAARQGFGWFVATEPIRQQLASLGTIEEQLEASGKRAERRVVEFGFVPLALEAFNAAFALAPEVTGSRLLALAATHPAGRYYTRLRAQRLLDGLEVVQPPEGEPEPSQHAPEYGAEASPAELIALAADLGRRLRGAARPARVR